MKEFALKHPWMTFFLVDAAIVNFCKLVVILTGHEAKTGAIENDEEEVKTE